MVFPRRSLVRSLVLVLALAVLLLASVAPAASAGRRQPKEPATSMVFTRAKNPSRTVVTNSGGTWMATFTDGSRTVALAGPERTLSEPDVEASIVSKTWVRLLPTPFAGTVDEVWLTDAAADRSPDVLATAIEYVAGAPTVTAGDGLVISSDASYGPIQPDGTRQEGSDWNDYRGVEASYPSGLDRPEPSQIGSLDCSGFIRMVWGVRHSIPLTLQPDGVSLPRRAVQMAQAAPGVLLVRDRGKQVTDFRVLQPGDLVFFDASSDDGTDIDHVGMYLGLDDSDRHRFVSSRKSIDGPTMGDYRGRSVLDGTGLYAGAFRSVRRL